MKNCYSSTKIFDEIKLRIKKIYKSQETFGRVFGASRKTISRILNHGTNISTFFKICKLLDIEAVLID